jgi:bacterioferritin (cytochrome b1)
VLKVHIYRSFLRPIQEKLLTRVFRQVVHNNELHILVMKLYLYGDSFGNATLQKFARLLQDDELKSKVERHYADEEKHAACLSQRIVELGGTPAFTPDELKLKLLESYFAQLNLLHTNELGLSEERLHSQAFLEVPEIIRFLVFAKAEEEQGALFFPAHLRALEKDTRTKALFEEIVQDELRHVTYLSEELESYRRLGYQREINEAMVRCRRSRHRLRLPFGEASNTFLTVLDMCHYRPVGKSAAVLMLFLRASLRAVKAVTRATNYKEGAATARPSGQ